MGLSVTATTMYAIEADFLFSFFPRHGKSTVLYRCVFHPLDRRADCALADTVFCRDAVLVRYSRKYFKVMYGLSSGVGFGGLPLFLCNALYFLENHPHFSKSSGFDPVQPLEKNVLGIFHLLSPAHWGLYFTLGY